MQNPTFCSDVSTWECVWFGNYWQEDTNGDGKADEKDDKEPIKWRVLNVDKTKNHYPMQSKWCKGKCGSYSS